LPNSGSMVCRERILLSRALSLATQEWGVHVHITPASRIRRPRESRARIPRLVRDEAVRLLAELEPHPEAGAGGCGPGGCRGWSRGRGPAMRRAATGSTAKPGLIGQIGPETGVISSCWRASPSDILSEILDQADLDASDHATRSLSIKGAFGHCHRSGSRRRLAVSLGPSRCRPPPVELLGRTWIFT